ALANAAGAVWRLPLRHGLGSRRGAVGPAPAPLRLSLARHARKNRLQVQTDHQLWTLFLSPSFLNEAGTFECLSRIALDLCAKDQCNASFLPVRREVLLRVELAMKRRCA